MPAIKLTAEEVTGLCSPDIFDFVTTEEVEPLRGFIGQERGAEAVEFGLKVKQQGYNIFISGLSGSGKNSFARTVVEEVAGKEEVPDDWCYIYNFESPNEPLALRLPAGHGKDFKGAVEQLIEKIQEEIRKVFEGENFENERTELIKEFQEESSRFMDELNVLASEMGFVLKRTAQGFATIPVVEDEEVEDLDKLDPLLRREIDGKSHELQLKAREHMRKIQLAEKEAREKLENLEYETAKSTLLPLFDQIQDKYGMYPEVLGYLQAVKDEILANLDVFRGKNQESEEEIPWLRWQKGNFFHKFQVNLFIDNQHLQGAPVVFESNPTYYNLVGRVEHESRWGMLSTDLTMIKPGTLHKANGGYLILKVKDVLANMGSWEALKRVLITGEIKLEGLGQEYSLFPISTSRPQAIPAKVKVILVGTPYLYHLLKNYDDDFSKLFKVKADFDTEMDRTPENVQKMARFTSYHCREKKLRHFHKEAVAKLVEYSSRLAQSQDKLTTRFNEVVEILYEANAWAQVEGSENVQKEHVVKAVEEKRFRNNLIETKSLKLYEEGTILLDVSGTKVGQINGLSVISTGDYSFGRPTRITATTYLGEKGIVNIDREIKMSGPIHNKGFLILTGYLGEKYGQKVPLNLSANLCFEQTYDGIEGDSASSTELYVLLSNLGDVPLDQGIAVTGSVNQKGEIQPVGGVTAKVEGFFEVCKRKGLTGEQGVIIPVQNIKDLVLNDELTKAIEEDKFHIYAVKDIDEGLEIITKKKAGKQRESGSYPRGSVHFQVLKKLQQYHDTMKTITS